MTAPKRYKHIFDLIEEFQPETIMEIGTWLGDNAVKMIEAAGKYMMVKNLAYYGFDLFEEITVDEIIIEHSKKTKSNYQETFSKLKKTGADITLCQGNTKDTLPKFPYTPIDFIFIDGGHSIGTIRSDWNNIQRFLHNDSIILFDDYYKNREDLGCKFLIDELEMDINFRVDHLFPEDVFDKISLGQSWKQYTRMVKVSLT